MENKKKKTLIEIIGRTNQGKSSLFNGLLYKNIVITYEEEHTTRDYVRFWGDNFVLTDNVGLDKKQLLDSRVFKSDVVLYVVSYDEISDRDKYYFKQLRDQKKSFYLVFTKCDNHQCYTSTGNISGSVEIFYSSTKNNYGLKELRSFLGISMENNEIIDDRKRKNTIALVGGVNSGKSSILNLLAGYNRNKVSGVAATTRDPIVEPIGDYYFIDTAGFNMIDKKVEKIALGRSLEILKNSDVVIIVVDATLSFSRWSKWLWLQCEKYNKGIIILFNKEDILEKENISKRYLLEKWSVKSYIPYLFFTGIYTNEKYVNRKLEELSKIIKQVIISKEKKITKSQINRFLKTITLPTNNNRINLVQKHPQEFLVYGKKPINENYKNYLENRIITYFKLKGIKPIIQYMKIKYD